jgi:hypothetical protein
VTSFSAHPLDPLYEGEPAQGDVDPSAVDLDAFLPALAALLRETVARFEYTSGRVSDLVIQQREQASLELIVALQDFDRLQQEFSALADALLRYLAAASPRTVPQSVAPDHDVINGILLDDMKRRLLRRLKATAAVERQVAEEQEF